MSSMASRRIPGVSPRKKLTQAHKQLFWFFAQCAARRYRRNVTGEAPCKEKEGRDKKKISNFEKKCIYHQQQQP